MDKYTDEERGFADDILEQMKLEIEALEIARSYIKPESIIEMQKCLNAAKRIFLMGEGRSGLSCRGGAMRITQIEIPDKSVHLAGDATTPTARRGDGAIAVSTSGESGTQLVMKYKAYGAKLIVLSAHKESTIGGAADVFVHIPEKEQILTQHADFALKVAKYKNWALLGTISETVALIYLDAFIGEWAWKMYRKDESDFKRAHHIKA